MVKNDRKSIRKNLMIFDVFKFYSALCVNLYTLVDSIFKISALEVQSKVILLIPEPLTPF